MVRKAGLAGGYERLCTFNLESAVFRVTFYRVRATP